MPLTRTRYGTTAEIGVPIQQGDVVSDPAGEFVVPRVKEGPTRLFVTGPGCALLASDFAPDDDDVTLPCSTTFSGLKVTLERPDSTPLHDERVYLRWNGVLIPRTVLMSHVAQYQTSWMTDAKGALSIVGIAPGNYDLFLGLASSEATIVANQRYGYVGSFVAESGATTELEFEVKIQ